MTVPTPDLSTDITSFDALVRRLNEQSVVPASTSMPTWTSRGTSTRSIPTDPRWELDGLDPLGQTAWYQSQPQEVRARHRPARHRQQDAGRLLLRGRAQARPARARHHPAGRLARAAVRVPRGHRGGAALPDVPGVRRRGRVTARCRSSRGEAVVGSRLVVKIGAQVPRAVLHLRARRRGSRSTTCNARPSARRRRASCTRCSSGSCGSTSPRRHATSPSPATGSSAACPSSASCAARSCRSRAPLILGEMGGHDAQAVARGRAEYGSPKDVLREAYDDNPDWQNTAAVSLRKVRHALPRPRPLNPLSKRLWKARRIWAD